MELPANAPQGLCPRCLAGMGMSLLPADPPPKPDIQVGRTGTMIGRYKLLEKIGEGGFGVVFMAEQVEPVQRKVALKIIKAGMDTREVIARFEAERQAIALMDHPNIARALDAGATDAGRPYFVMELVRGIPLTDYCDQHQLPTRERLQLFIKVCQAVQHAHQKGVIHRDLKPSNVLVTEHDGEPVPKVIDFGVAKALGKKLTEKTLFTSFNHMIGTPAYMSPEQAALSGLDIDTRADIYSLGVLLYELLTGVTPFDTDTFRKAAMDEVRRMIQETEPPKPSTRLHTLGDKFGDVAKHRSTEPAALGRLVRGDLDWIVMKCLEKDRQRRYETANGLAMDLQRYLTSEPVMARAPGNFYRFQKLVRRHKAAVAATSIVATSLIVGMGISTWLFFKERAVLHESYVAQARANRLSGQPGRYFGTLETIAKAVAIRPSLELRNEYIASLALVDLRMVPVGEMNSSDTEFLRFDRTFEVYAQTTHEGDISVRRVNDNRELKLLPTRGMGVRWLHCFNRDGRYLAFHTVKFDDCVWDLHNDEMAFQGMKRGLVFSPDGGSFVSMDPDGVISIYELDSRQVTRRKTEASESSLAKSLDPTGNRLICFDSHTLGIEIVELNSGKVKTRIKVAQHCDEFAWSTSDRWLAAACRDGRAYIWDAASGDLLQTCVGHGSEVIRLAFNHTDTLLATSSYDNTVRLWDPYNGAQLLRFRGSSWQMQFSPDDRRLAFVPDGKKFGLLEVANHPEYRRWRPHRNGGSALHVTVSPDHRLTATTWDGIRFWDFSVGKEIAFLPERGCLSAIFDPDGTSLITCGLSGLKRWPIRAKNGTSLDEFQIGPDFEVYAAVGSGLGLASMSADGNKIAFVHYSERDKASVIDRRNPEEIIMLGNHPGVQHVSISADGKWVATGTWKGSGVIVWAAETGSPLCTLPPPASATVLFSPDGRWLVTGSSEYQLWETGTWKPGPTISLTPPNAQLGVMAFSADSQLLAIALRDKGVRLLETKTARTLADLEPPDISLIQGLCFSQEGSQLLASDGVGQVHAWDLRLIRERLAQMKLDWEMPPYSPSDAPHQSKPVIMEVISAEEKP